MTTTAQIAMGSSTGRGPYNITLPTGITVGGRHVLTGTITTREEWVAVRYTVCTAELTRRGWPVGQAEGASLVAVTIWALENGWGAGEWHYNVGNIHCTPGTSARCTTVNGHDGTENLVAWSDIVEGVAEWWGLITRRYSAALPQFRVGDLLAWNTLRCGGYGGSSVTADEAISIHNRVRRTISEDWDQLADEGRQRVVDGWIPASRLGSCGGRSTGPDTGYGPTGTGTASSSSSRGGSSGGGALLIVVGLLLAAMAAASSKKKG